MKSVEAYERNRVTPWSVYEIIGGILRLFFSLILGDLATDIET